MEIRRKSVREAIKRSETPTRQPPALLVGGGGGGRPPPPSASAARAATQPGARVLTPRLARSSSCLTRLPHAAPSLVSYFMGRHPVGSGRVDYARSRIADTAREVKDYARERGIYFPGRIKDAAPGA
ncbi:uncharacterized protein A4U43_UnF7130 [Asparagus officinalis]|uniref:Uncharacterized protein n=1 Tax=Asparagus officinalis TaxID=4686 RepID=A0A1R3L6A9_ASPOF|nr:uncharacterized protein A4U43_UnF7130 [Asparagus officinalis]